jgi:hypothetical protein
MNENADEPTTVDDTEELSTAVESSDESVPADDLPEPESDPEPDTFPREVVEKLRQENGKYRQRAQLADTYAQRLHTELVRATGKLADPTDLPFDEAYIDDADALNAAIDELATRKPHLATRRPSGDIGQGQRGSAAQPFSLLGLLKERA